MPSKVTVKIPKELAEKFEGENLKSIQKYISEILALDLYMREEVSFGRAAELAGLSYDDFWNSVQERGFKLRVGPKTVEEARKEYEDAKGYVKA